MAAVFGVHFGADTSFSIDPCVIALLLSSYSRIAGTDCSSHLHSLDMRDTVHHCEHIRNLNRHSDNHSVLVPVPLLQPSTWSCLVPEVVLCAPAKMHVVSSHSSCPTS
ncbi:hypothetical protein PsorP6_008618 [Peronosclerospora sorghi]|uniref:Uncharacterized protein n=1 Tax=Peronosclerospora sorghi TaxID=230839 RepID=A0ACC0WCR4_9STRA|nr:hypothetical protein PsorP6_008618 [Peronosclerospora sorghi]